MSCQQTLVPDLSFIINHHQYHKRSRGNEQLCQEYQDACRLFNREYLGVSRGPIDLDNEEVLADPIVARGELYHDAIRIAAVVELAAGEAATCVIRQSDLI